MLKIDLLKYVVVDTNILVNGIVVNEKSSSKVVNLLEEYKVKLATTTPIINEYRRVFSRPETGDHRIITDEHRSKLNELVKQSHLLRQERLSTELSEHYTDLYTKDLQPDYKLIIAANMAAGETAKPGVLVSNDRCLVDKWQELARVRVLAMTAYDFIGSFT